MKDNSKKGSVSRSIARIIFILMAIIFVCIFVISIYLGGQIKTIDKYYTAIERSDNKSLHSVLYNEVAISDDSELLQEPIRKQLEMKDDENFFIKTKFVSREYISLNHFNVQAKITYYNDTNYYVEFHNFSLKFRRGKWYIDAIVNG